MSSKATSSISVMHGKTVVDSGLKHSSTSLKLALTLFWKFHFHRVNPVPPVSVEKRWKSFLASVVPIVFQVCLCMEVLYVDACLNNKVLLGEYSVE